MLRPLFVLPLLAAVMFTPARASRNEAIVDASPALFELVIVEVEGCLYCEMMRRDVMSSFTLTPEARGLPVRFLDLNAPEARNLDLTEGPLTTVPTVLLVKGNREIARAPGYMGSDGFMRAVRWMLGQAS